MLPQAASEYDRSQRRLTATTLAATGRAWRGMGDDFDGSWRQVGLQIRSLAFAGQLAAARGADPYLSDVLPELGIRDEPQAAVRARGFVGVAGDGRPVESLLYGSVTTAKAAVASGAPVGVALEQGGAWLSMTVQTLVADTARGAVGAGMTARPAVTGWVRMLELPSCARCVILAGRFYRRSQGFARHPRCDCRHIPATENVAADLTTDPRAAYEAGQVRGLTDSQRRALDEGADLGRVVNSRRGMDTASSLTTREGAGRSQRLSPEGIYTRTGQDRDAAVALLREHGYLT
jgi:hypothetical protein